LWFGTADGLNRYDGRDFVVFRHDSKDPQSLSSNWVQALLEDSSGSLWVGTSRGLDRLDRRSNRFANIGANDPQGPASQGVLVLYQDRAGAIWVGLESGLLRITPETGAIETYRHDPEDSRSIAPGTVLSVQEEPGGDLWVLTGQWGRGVPATLNRFDRENNRFVHFVAPDGWDRVGALLIDRAGSFWLNVSGLGAFEPNSGRFSRPLFDNPYAAMRRRVHEDRLGRLWIPTQSGVILFDPSSSHESVHTPGTEENRLSNFVEAVLEDRAGIIWFGTRGGLHKWDRHRKPFLHWKHQKGDTDSLGSSQVSAVLEDSSGTIWMGTYGGGLNRLDSPNGIFTRYRHDPDKPESLCHDSVWDIAEDGRGTLWLGVEAGLCSYDPKDNRFTLHEVDQALADGHDRRIENIEVDSWGTLWLGTPYGLVRFEPESGRSRRYIPTGDRRGPSHSVIGGLLVADGRTLWIGAGRSGQGLDRLDIESDTFTHYPMNTKTGETLHGEGIFQVYRDRKNRLWLATGGGLFGFDPERQLYEHYAAREGLAGSVVYSILEDEDGRLWLGTNRGLLRFDPRRPPQDRFRSFDLSDGIGNMEFNRHAALRATTGRFFFGGMSGLTVFRPQEIRDNDLLPPVVLTRILLWQTQGAREVNPFGLEHLRLSHREDSFSFEFAALSYTSPEKNRFAYMLEGLDDGWVDGGTHNACRYVRVPPGAYVFRVKACNNDGVWNEDGVALEVTITPPFWKTTWFRLVMGALAVAGVAATHRYRIAKLLEVERLRVRIAGDLHDDLSSELSGIALTAGMMHREDHLSDGDRGRLGEVERTARDVLGGLQDIVWYINPEHDNLDALVRRMKRFASRLLIDINHTFESELPATEAAIDMEVRRDFFMIFKEIVHNVARHSRAESAAIRLLQKNGGLILEVRDDGVGFDPESSSLGLGLKSMRRRSLQIGASLVIDSAPGHGTKVRLTAKTTRTRGSRTN
jgi:ligand-binding sensor domain-containing protein/signal transduction histidine kinase